MDVASRTPEGDPNVCPVCGNRLVLEPSRPSGDAPCPSCGCLVWFGPSEEERQRTTWLEVTDRTKTELARQVERFKELLRRLPKEHRANYDALLDELRKMAGEENTPDEPAG
jgi:uncharacterized Zn finger protein (UPF0148 family)